ncbi:murein biosynthesis integral membrane protein MurJ [Leptolyngbya sp. FACHB-261]|uniref:murein biosynthesis integral membrane protein MurJ n=1 Tax=Leptolyngbya sp. FACHB-261 TaxID=2692806 RepID=UPI001681EEC4|nr:murein biosynthesis integral membrane protein MurJ [Leptolyngbya sp. FACHB-261]MBD2104466.1 murein biosynthesis integral membrane protein MurJ [Leptolyngbya sp. FACHB-261]
MSDVSKPARSLAGIAGIVAVATLISKLAGLVRQQVIAAEFGVGPAVDAYTYAYVIPGFLFILLGGINGPFHSSIISVLAKRPKEEAAPLVETITTLVGGVLLLVTVGLMLFAEPLIQLIAPGAPPEVRTIAVEQFRIMAPLAVFSGLIGIGFGTLNAADLYWLPSVSPMFSSGAVVVAVLLFAERFGPAVLAWGTLFGAVLQWLVQIPPQWKAGMGTLRLRFEFKRPGMGEISKLMGPATLSSGMLLINVYTSLLFASQLPVGAAAALGYAQLLVLTPLGILSNVILVPYLPIFAKAVAAGDWVELKERIRQSLVLTALTMMPLGALMSVLALPAVRVIYERDAFDLNASQLVSSVLVAYAVGMFVYLGRDVLVRVFYALGDGEMPFKVSLLGVGLNIAFCALFTKTSGAAGLALATATVNLISMAIMLRVLGKRLNGLAWQGLGWPLVGLLVGSGLTGLVGWGVLQGTQRLWGTEGLGLQLLELALAGGLGIAVFALCILPLRLPEVDMFTGRLLAKLRR